MASLVGLHEILSSVMLRRLSVDKFQSRAGSLPCGETIFAEMMDLPLYARNVAQTDILVSARVSRNVLYRVSRPF